MADTKESLDEKCSLLSLGNPDTTIFYYMSFINRSDFETQQ